MNGINEFCEILDIRIIGIKGFFLVNMNIVYEDVNVFMVILF